MFCSGGSCGASKSRERLTSVASSLEKVREGFAVKSLGNLIARESNKGAGEGGVKTGPKKLMQYHHIHPLLRTREGAVK